MARDSDPQALVAVEHIGSVAVVRLSRPPVNALSMALLDEIASTFESLASQTPGAVVLTGSEKIFAAGAEIKEFSDPQRASEISGLFARATLAIEAFPRAVIAAVEGFALGGGCEVALACDFRVASTRCVFGQPEILLGIIPGGGGTQRLVRLVGRSRALEMMLSGRQVKAEEALAIGLADRVVEAGQTLEAALDWANSLAAGPVVAQGLLKRAVNDGSYLDIKAALEVERKAFAEVFQTNDAATGIASFLANGPGKATFSGS